MKKHVLFAASLLMAATMSAEVTPATWSMLNAPLTTEMPTGLASTAMIWGDYDNDGDLDIFVLGGQSTSLFIVGLWKNNGNQTWTPVEISEDFQQMYNASAAWVDYNRDGNLDLVCTGTMDGATTSTMVFKNLGPNEGYAFEEDLDNFLPGCYTEGNDNNMTIAVLDYNNDGWMDIVLNGNAGGKWDGTNSRMVALFKNTNGVFSADGTATLGAETFAQINGGSVIACDVNGDGWIDLLTCGYDDNAIKPTSGESGNGASYLYFNDGNGGFVKNTAVTFTGAQQGALFGMDVNSDGKMDLVEFGRDIDKGWANFGNVWINDEMGFTKVTTPNIAGTGGNFSIGDINNDGYPDFVYAGWPAQNVSYGNGDGTFTEQTLVEAGLANMNARGGAVNLVDFTGDNALDMQISGYSDNLGNWACGFANSTNVTNAAPAAPSNLAISEQGGKIFLSWDAASDDKTPAAALRYNVYAKTADGQIFSLVPADPATGKQKIGGGYIYYTHITGYVFTTKDFVEYGVQTIDGCGAASAFTTVATGLESVKATNANSYKYMENGNLYILRGGVKYTVAGQTAE